jgi:hypothetical protein
LHAWPAGAGWLIEQPPGEKSQSHGGGGGGGVVQIFQPEFCTERSDDQVIDEAATSWGPVVPLYGTPFTVNLSQHDSVEKAELVSTAEGEKVTVHSSLLLYVPERELQESS